MSRVQKHPRLAAGATFGRLTVLEYVPVALHPYQLFVACSCTCGTRRHVTRADHLRNGTTTSCGCFLRERAAASSTRYVHGRTRARDASPDHATEERKGT